MRARIYLLALLCCSTLSESAAAVKRRHRRRFEATDLEQERPGELNFDLEAGLVRQRSGYRAMAPDFEIGLGLDERAELIIDGSYYTANPDAPDLLLQD